MSRDGYVLLRASTLAWLLERHRTHGEDAPVPEEVALDLRVAAPSVPVRSELDPFRAMGPVLTVEQHEALLQDELRLPADAQAGAFWRQVVAVSYAMMRNEAEAAMRLLAGDEEG